MFNLRRAISDSPRSWSSTGGHEVTVLHIPLNPDALLPPPIPRKRGRKANKGGHPAKRQRQEAGLEALPKMRLTRAAIKAEEEAQDTLDVLSALTGDLNWRVRGPRALGLHGRWGEAVMEYRPSM